MNVRTLARLALMVKALRRRRGLTQAELARRSGVSRQWIIALESDPPVGVEMGKLMKTLDALDASFWIHDDIVDVTP